MKLKHYSPICFYVILFKTESASTSQILGPTKPGSLLPYFHTKAVLITAGSIKIHTKSSSLPSLSTPRLPTLCNALRKDTRRILDAKSTSFTAFAYFMGIRNTHGRILWKECKGLISLQLHELR